MFAERYQCPVVAVEGIERSTYRAIGCGHEAVYQCRRPGSPGPACYEVQAPPRVTPTTTAAPSTYPWPPVEGRFYDHVDEFEGYTIVQADMTLGHRVLRVFAAPRRAPDDVFVDVLLPDAPAPGPACAEIVFLVGDERVRVARTEERTGGSGEPVERFQVPVAVLERGAASSMKFRFCEVDWTFTSPQLQSLAGFAARLRAVRERERPPSDAGPSRAPDAS